MYQIKRFPRSFLSMQRWHVIANIFLWEILSISWLKPTRLGRDVDDLNVSLNYLYETPTEVKSNFIKFVPIIHLICDSYRWVKFYRKKTGSVLNGFRTSHSTAHDLEKYCTKVKLMLVLENARHTSFYKQQWPKSKAPILFHGDANHEVIGHFPSH